MVKLPWKRECLFDSRIRGPWHPLTTSSNETSLFIPEHPSCPKPISVWLSSCICITFEEASWRLGPGWKLGWGNWIDGSFCKVAATQQSKVDAEDRIWEKDGQDPFQINAFLPFQINQRIIAIRLRWWSSILLKTSLIQDLKFSAGADRQGWHTCCQQSFARGHDMKTCSKSSVARKKPQEASTWIFLVSN